MILERFRLTDKVALVTGAGRGIGRGIALAYAEAGADVVLAARTAEQIEKVAEEVRGLGRRALTVPCDVTDAGQLDALVGAALEEFGRVDILINNAGYRPRRTFMDMTTAEWRAVLATNLDGPFFCAKAVIPSMISNGSGSIVNLSGMNSFSGAHWPHVCASKMGALGLTRALAVELGPNNIRVNYVVPGGWDESATSFEDMAPESRGQERIPLRRLGIPQELANLYAFLASDDSSYITGQTFHINGGSARY